MLNTLLLFCFDALLFVAVPYILWLLYRRTMPLAILPILVGLLLATSGLAATYHPTESAISNIIGFVGVLLLAFSAGLEAHTTPANASDANTQTARTKLRLLTSAMIALAIPFAIGALTTYWYFNQLPGWDDTQHGSIYSALAIGLCLAVSALPVLIGIVRELPTQHRYLGALALKLAVMDDVVLWSGLAILLFVAGVSDSTSWALEELIAILLLLLLLFISRQLYKKVLELPNSLVWVLALAYLSMAAYSTYTLGLHAILGAYYAGAVFPKYLLKRLPATTLGRYSLLLFAPFFFGYSGMRINPDALTSTALYAATLLVILSVLTKAAAMLIYRPVAQLSCRETLSVAVFLQCKGLMEIVAATMLYQHGLLAEHAYAALVTLAIISTALTGPLFRCLNQHRFSMIDSKLPIK